MPEPQHIAPSFAREAAQHMQDDNIQRALELCMRGTKEYPRYATGYFILGRCYEALNRTVDALVEYNNALAILPDSATLLSFVQRAEETRQREFEKYAEEQKKRGGNAAPPLTLEEFLGEERVKIVALPTQPASHKQSEETALEHLAKKLKNVQRIKPNPDIEPSHVHTDDDGARVAFATATMADILVSKGQYAEAMKIFKELLTKNPDDEARLKGRIAEMEGLLANKRDKQGGTETTKASS